MGATGDYEPARSVREAVEYGTRAVPVAGHPGVEHDGCRYRAPVLLIEGGGTFWFCNKCGQGDEVFPC